MEASPLPLDLLLEISARCDPATVARCGATCKLLRRHVTDPPFLRRVRAVSSSNRFLVGLLYHRSYISDRDPPAATIRRAQVAVGGRDRGAWIEVPQDCHRRRREAITGEAPRELLLASSAGGELALLVWERPLAVCMWTRTIASSSSGRSWARRVVIDRTAILASVQPACNPLACQRVELLLFAEGSGTVVFHLNAAGTALLNLRTLEVRHIQRSGLEPFEFSPFCVYD
ncbi:unnamed protein product [Urochloa decumbens]|uniref:F-box domain-containing protein n=1 Tax=Urochloa decumbens TaxID=240449 RepID=A0ABC9CJR6_9POAL